MTLHTYTYSGTVFSFDTIENIFKKITQGFLDKGFALTDIYIKTYFEDDAQYKINVQFTSDKLLRRYHDDIFLPGIPTFDFCMENLASALCEFSITDN